MNLKEFKVQHKDEPLLEEAKHLVEFEADKLVDNLNFSINALSHLGAYLALWGAKGFEALGANKDITPDELKNLTQNIINDLASNMSTSEYEDLKRLVKKGIEGVDAGEIKMPSDFLKFIIKNVPQIEYIHLNKGT